MPEWYPYGADTLSPGVAGVVVIMRFSIIVIILISVIMPSYGDESAANPASDGAARESHIPAEFIELDALVNKLRAGLGGGWRFLTASNDYVVFWNDKSVRRENNGLLSAFYLYSFTKSQKYNGKEYLSDSVLGYVDCYRTAFSAKAETLFSDQLGRGEIVASYSNTESAAREHIERVTPGMIKEEMIHATCEKYSDADKMK